MKENAWGAFPEGGGIPEKKTAPDAAETVRNRLSAMGLRPDPFRYDEELFSAHAGELLAEWRNADRTQRLEKGMRWYFDAVAPERFRTESTHEERAGAAPVIRQESETELPGLRIGQNASLLNGARHSPDRPSSFGLYGPSRMVDVVPGGYAVMRLDECDVVGTSDLSQCQALIVTEHDKVALSHVLYGQEADLPEIMASLGREFGPEATWRYAYPDAVPAPDASEEEKAEAVRHNDRYLRMIASQGLHPVPYYRPDARHNPQDIGGTSVIVSRAGIALAGTRFTRRHPGWKGARARQWMEGLRDWKEIL